MRTAHLIVSGAAFAVWLAACVVYCLMCENWVTEGWYLYGSMAVLPSFWCVYAWFASRRSDEKTVRWLTWLAVPGLLCGLGMSFVVAGDVLSQPPDGVDRPIGMGAGMAAECCWTPVALCGLVSFIWAVWLQLDRMFPASKER